jgi:D-alanyl-D-alanine carboxypeptidase (penicillin-binding protein 5/6)
MSLPMPARPFALLLAVLISACMAAAAEAAAPVPPPPPIAARSYVLLDALSGRIIAAQNDTEHSDPASLTKLMTAYVVFDALKSGKLKLDQPVTVSEHAWRSGGARTDGSTSFLDLNSKVPVEDLLLGMIVQSGNDASIALAEAVAGSEDTFAVLMNQYAQRLGLADTHYTNSWGDTHPGHYSTARDVGLLSVALVRDFPQYYRWFSQRSFTYHGIKQGNRNGLLDRDATVDGIKTGHTDAAGYCLAASALRNGTRLVSVVMHTASQKAREEASEALLGYGFNFYETRQLYRAGQTVGTAKVYKAGQPVNVILHQDFIATAARGELAGAKAVVVVGNPLIAPIKSATPLGRLRVTVGETLIGELPVFAERDVETGSLYRRLVDTVRLWLR